ncbi:DUF2793 domain-containing protein [Stenotrophomonas sp. ATCM1_4]|uniref:DUF2793 domain-containing protein n=1 Tax=Stenotrophomonas sp. ATCM1_4 TaxID=2259330 RepID=UPI00104A1E32|nr:DUF2793 domain-containing protein [Stenotrophomonas sp. ATCM1_4]TDB26384.1 DUF2793 domain-containing protein [Stenotrophomonas sp. ATCM1_4]
MSTPNLGLELVPSNSLQPSVPINDTLQAIDALLQLAVVDKDLAAPPTTVESDSGKRWIIGPAATGAWTGKSGQVALCTGATLWRFLEPRDGWEAVVLDEGALGTRYRYIGGAWSAV